ncbi:MAG: hypothetical protein FJ102_22865 [Deltaproteobacteria bacterium]|nr:hypothetical protein [Deltaproteobacteria bacterium]
MFLPWLLGCVMLFVKPTQRVEVSGLADGTPVVGPGSTAVVSGGTASIDVLRPPGPTNHSRPRATLHVGENTVEGTAFPDLYLRAEGADGCTRYAFAQSRPQALRFALVLIEMPLMVPAMVDIFGSMLGKQDRFSDYVPRRLDFSAAPCTKAGGSTRILVQPHGDTELYVNLVTGVSSARHGDTVVVTYSLAPLGHAPLYVDVKNGSSPWLMYSRNERGQVDLSFANERVVADGTDKVVTVKATDRTLMTIGVNGILLGGLGLVGGALSSGDDNGLSPVLYGLGGLLAAGGTVAVVFGAGHFEVQPAPSAAP